MNSILKRLFLLPVLLLLLLPIFLPKHANAIGLFDISNVVVSPSLVSFDIANLDRSNDGNNGGYDGIVMFATVYCYDTGAYLHPEDPNPGVYNSGNHVSFVPESYDGSTHTDCVGRVYSNGGLNDYSSRQSFDIPTTGSLTPTPTPTSTPPTPSPTPANYLSALSPAKIWVGLKNSDDVGVKFDLRAEIFAGNTPVSSRDIFSVPAGSSGFNNAKLNTMNFDPFPPVILNPGDQLSIRLSVRNACNGSGHNSGTARLWYGDSQANSLFDATINNIERNYYLVNTSGLSTSVGVGPKKTVDVAAGAKCSAFKEFGTWSITP